MPNAKLLVTACTLLAGVIGTAHADSSPGTLAWRADRLLTWDDFRGPPDAGAPAERVALTAHSLAWTYRYDVKRVGDVCSYRITELRATASFQPALSWVKPRGRTEAVLNHEQGHFDLTEIHKRRFDERTQAFVNTQRSCGRGARASKRIEAEIEGLVRPLFDEVWEAHLQVQDDYDAETAHGTLPAMQALWDQRIERWLSP